MATAPLATRPLREATRRALAALLGAASLLASCRGKPVNTLPEVNQLMAARRFPQALRRAESGLSASPAAASVFWDLALRKAQILEKLERNRDALAWLRSINGLRGAAPRQALLLASEQAAIERDLGLYQEANRDLVAAIAVARSASLPAWVANLDVRLSETLVRLGSPADAGAVLDEADQYERDHHDTALIPYILNNRGLALLTTNRFEDALRQFDGALSASQSKGIKTYSAKVMINQAWCHYRLGNLERAQTLYKDAASIAAPEDRHLCLGHLGNLYRDAQDYSRAADSYHQAADLARGHSQEYYSIWLGNLAGTLCDQGKWAEAEDYNRQALAAKKDIQSAKAASFETINAARIEASRNRREAAEALYRQVFATPSADPSAVLEANSRLAQAFAAAGRTEEARSQFKTALAMADQRRAGLQEDENKLAYLAHLIDLNQSYVEFLASHGDSEGAFAAAEASRARLLRDRLNQATAAPGEHSIADYQAAAGASGVTFLAYWIAPEKSYLWEITGAGFHAIPLPGEREIRPLVDHYQAGLEKDHPLDLASGRRLFQMLLGPVAPSPGGRYVIVPDGPLYGLNLETLPSGADGRYWIEDATVMVTPSLGLLLAGHSAPRANRRLLLVGDAAEWDDSFPRLPYAQREMQSVAKSFPAAAVTSLAGADASPAGYQRSHPESYGFIHFAAHATASRDAPLDSAIVLAREGSQGKLSVRDLLGMHTQAELVTLSACQSAGARTYAGEGLVGLAWAFLQSGAGSVIAGLWNVSDYSSPRLMEHLYAGVSAGRSPAAALRSAKLDLIHASKYNHPFYWGAFQLYAGSRER